MSSTNEKSICDLTKAINTEKVSKIYEYLKSTDFFSAPASHAYHHSYEGGLAAHCSEVFINLGKLAGIIGPESLSNEDKYLLAFGHDLAKINFYELSSRNTKINGRWESVPCFSFTNRIDTFDHEVDSMYRLMRLVPDTDFNILQAIRYHHGAFNDSTKGDYSKYCRSNPLVLMLHTADMMSAIQGDLEMDKIRKQRGY